MVKAELGARPKPKCARSRAERAFCGGGSLASVGGGESKEERGAAAGDAARQGDGVKAGKKEGERGLAGAGRANDSHTPSRVEAEGNVLKRRGISPDGLEGQLPTANQARTLSRRVRCKWRMRDHRRDGRPCNRAQTVQNAGSWPASCPT